MAINPDLLKPFVKVSIRDLVRSRVEEEIQMVWIQGTLTLIENNVIELKYGFCNKSFRKDEPQTS